MAVITGGRVGGAVLSALWLVVAARELPLNEFADLSLIIALGSMLFFLTDAGYSTLLSAHVAKVGWLQPSALTATIARRLAGVVISMTVMLPAFLLVANDRDLVAPLLYSGALAGNAVHGSVSAALRAVGRSTAEAVNEIVSRSLVVLVGGVWLARGGGLAAAVAVLSAVELASAVALLCVARGPMRAGRNRDGERLDVRWRSALPIAVGAGFSTVYGRIDTWLVGLLAAPGSAGLYAACYRIAESLRLPAQAAGAVTLADACRPGSPGVALARRRALVAAVVTAVPATVIAVLARPLLRVTFGTNFAVAAPTLRVLALSAVASAAVSVLAPTVAVRAGRAFAVSIALVTLLNVACNVALVPRFAGSGAAWANAGSELLLVMLLVRACAPRSYRLPNTYIPSA